MIYIKSKGLIVFSLAVLVIFNLSCHTEDNPLTYIDPVQPGLEALKFAPGFISKDDESEFGSVFSQDGQEFYYAVDTDGKAEIRYTFLVGKVWSSPKTILSHDKYGYNDPFLSPDGNRLYYISNQIRNDLDTINDIDIWYSTKEGNQWSNPINAGDKINSDKNEYYMSFTADGTIYFASNVNADEGRDHDFDIYSAKMINDQFQQPIKLSDSINTRRYEADVFIAPDESYIIFASARRDGFGNGDLHISFKLKEGHWTEAVNMGKTINSKGNEICPYVTPDGKYLFYTSNQDIYWISTDILEKYRLIHNGI